jgi:hypothetical protein
MRLKITLREIRPPVWRRLLVPSDASLRDLHVCIQAAFGWYDMHLHGFAIGDETYGDPTILDDALDERRLTLAGIRRLGLKRFVYTYDYGDDWEHLIDIEADEARKPGITYPCCVGGRRAAPPEDCGGPFGYLEAMAVIGDPSHPDHDEYVERVGADFDPRAFSTDEVNAALAASFGSGPPG